MVQCPDGQASSSVVINVPLNATSKNYNRGNNGKEKKGGRPRIMLLDDERGLQQVERESRTSWSTVENGAIGRIRTWLGRQKTMKKKCNSIEELNILISSTTALLGTPLSPTEALFSATPETCMTDLGSALYIGCNSLLDSTHSLFILRCSLF